MNESDENLSFHYVSLPENGKEIIIKENRIKRSPQEQGKGYFQGFEKIRSVKREFFSSFGKQPVWKRYL